MTVHICRALGLALFMATMCGAFAAAPAELRGHGGSVRALATSPSGEVLTGSFDTRAIIWDAASGAAKSVLQWHHGSVTAVAFLPDGRVATGGQDGRIALWRDDQREPDRVMEAHDGPVSALAVSPDGLSIASSGWDRTAVLTPLNGEAALEFSGHSDNVNGVAFLSGGRLATAGYDGTVRLWDRDGGDAAVLGIGVPLNALAADPLGGFWTAGADGSLRAFDKEGRSRGDVQVSRAPLVALAAGEELVAAGSLDGTVALVEPDTLSVVRVLEASSGPVWSVAFEPRRGAVLIGGADHVVRPWDPRTGVPLGDTQEVIELERFGDSRGAQVFRKCAACHALGPDDGNRAGPTLHGIMGRPVASVGGYGYSEALRGMAITWTPDSIARLFEIGPSAMTPGTSMPEQRIADPEDRAALIDFLRQHTR